MSLISDVLVDNNRPNGIEIEKNGDIKWHDGLSDKTLSFITKQHKSNYLLIRDQLGNHLNPGTWFTKIPFTKILIQFLCLDNLVLPNFLCDTLNHINISQVSSQLTPMKYINEPVVWSFKKNRKIKNGRNLFDTWNEQL